MTEDQQNILQIIEMDPGYYRHGEAFGVAGSFRDIDDAYASSRLSFPKSYLIIKDHATITETFGLFNTMQEIFSNLTATISDLQNNPRSIWEHDEPVAIFDHNEPIGYCIPKELYFQIMNALEDAQLTRIIQERKNDKEIEVKWDDL